MRSAILIVALAGCGVVEGDRSTATAGGGGALQAGSAGQQGGGLGASAGAAGAVQTGGAGPQGGGSGASNPPVCGSRTETLEAHCGGPCERLAEHRCWGGVVRETVAVGCGYVRSSVLGDVGDAWGRIYRQSDGALVFAWNNGKLSVGCTDAIRAGEEPLCGEWTVVPCSSVVGMPSGVGGGGADGGAGTGGRDSSLGGGGAGGEGGQPGFDPACHCVFDDFSSECSLPIELFVRRVPAPSSCVNDLDFVQRADCADGTTRRSWLEGGENDYLLVRDEQGAVVYGYASGYVGGLCNIEEPEFQFGTITAGTRPAPSVCETCSVCEAGESGGSGGSLPQCL